MSVTEAVSHERPVNSEPVIDRTRSNPESVLCFGSLDAMHTFLRAALGDATDVTVVEPTNCMWAQITQQFDIVLIDGRTVAITTPEGCRAVVHAAVQHLSPGGQLIASFAPDDRDLARFDQMCAEFDLTPDGRAADTDGVCIVHRRTSQTTVHDLVYAARSRITRIKPDDLRAALDSRHPPTVVDTRTNTDRERFGVIHGSIHIPRTTLEWACDPSNGYRHPMIRSHDQSLVIVCNGGYSSSLAAANLALLGFGSVVDLIGGHQAWVRAGHEVVRPDHSSLDY
jgi:rhodanese-related sulfurtransferase